MIGANGAGKSSILRAITGLQPIRSGSKSDFQGERIDGTKARPRSSKLGIAMVPEGRRVFPYMSVKDNLLMGAFTAQRQGRRSAQARWRWCWSRFPRLKERYSQSAGTLSGGEQQMMVIGRALMARPRLLILDEPSLGIAPKLVQDIARSIVAINRDAKSLRAAGRAELPHGAAHLAPGLCDGDGLRRLERPLRRSCWRTSRIKAAYLGGEV